MDITGFLTAVFTRSYEAVYRWGYIGILLAAFIESASFSLFPLPTMAFIFTFGGILNPFLVGFLGGLGSTFGSLVAYIVGRGGKDFIEKKYGKKLEMIGRKFEQYGGFLWIMVANLTPFLPDNGIALFCGMVRYDIKKYFAASLISKILFNLILAYAGYYGINFLLNLFQLKLP